MRPRNTIGAWLKTTRQIKRLTQQEVADRVGCAKSYFSSLERDKVHCSYGRPPQPPRWTIERLAEALDESPAQALIAAGYIPENIPSQPRWLHSYEELDQEDQQLVGEFVELLLRHRQHYEGKDESNV